MKHNNERRVEEQEEFPAGLRGYKFQSSKTAEISCFLGDQQISSLFYFYLFLRNNLSLSVKAKSTLSPFEGTRTECCEVEASQLTVDPMQRKKNNNKSAFLLRISSSGAPAEPE